MSRVLALLVAITIPATGCTWVEARARDAADCVRGAVGVGPGLAVDARMTDWISPGIGIVTRTTNWGWLDRRVHGTWQESDVINTPRLAYETIGSELYTTSDPQAGREMSFARLAASSLNLPNERWIQRRGVTSVEYFSFFNAFGAAEASRARWLADLLVEPGQPVFVPNRTAWQKGFVEVGATVLLVHARAGFNPFELIDFLAGLVGLDPAGDDTRAPHYPLVPREDADRDRIDRLFDPGDGDRRR